MEISIDSDSSVDDDDRITCTLQIGVDVNQRGYAFSYILKNKDGGEEYIDFDFIDLPDRKFGIDPITHPIIDKVRDSFINFYQSLYEEHGNKFKVNRININIERQFQNEMNIRLEQKIYQLFTTRFKKIFNISIGYGYDYYDIKRHRILLVAVNSWHAFNEIPSNMGKGKKYVHTYISYLKLKNWFLPHFDSLTETTKTKSHDLIDSYLIARYEP